MPARLVIEGNAHLCNFIVCCSRSQIRCGHPTFALKKQQLSASQVYAKQKNQLWQLENVICKALSARDVNFDNQFSLVFSCKPDTRDIRPAVYPGRIMFPGGFNMAKSVWRNTPLMKSGRTEEAPMVLQNNMLYVENLNEQALPNRC